MNIDRRIEALTQSVELLAHMHEDFETAQQTAHQRIDEEMAKTHTMLTQVTVNIDSLVLIARVHERRISDLAGGPRGRTEPGR